MMITLSSQPSADRCYMTAARSSIAGTSVRISPKVDRMQQSATRISPMTCAGYRDQFPFRAKPYCDFRDELGGLRGLDFAKHLPVLLRIAAGKQRTIMIWSDYEESTSDLLRKCQTLPLGERIVLLNALYRPFVSKKQPMTSHLSSKFDRVRRSIPVMQLEKLHYVSGQQF